MKAIIARLKFKLFIWLGSQFFSAIAIYNPTNDRSGRVLALHFAVNEYHLRNAVEALADDYEKQRNDTHEKR